MRVTIAASACLVALMCADVASAADGVTRPLPALLCVEPARGVELSFSTDAAIGGSGAPAIRADLEEGEPIAPNEGATLWCVSADDPRCSPIENSAPTSLSFGQAKLGCTFDWSLGVSPLVPAAASGCRADYRGSARDGVLGRLERPPRAFAG